MKHAPFCPDPFSYRRRLTREVNVGKVGVGGHHPIRVQSMITCDTMDTEACIRQTMELAAVGCEIVRITAPTVKDAQNLQDESKRDYLREVAMFRSSRISISNRKLRWKRLSGSKRFGLTLGTMPIQRSSPSKSTATNSICAELDRIRERFTRLVHGSRRNAA